ncbi:hypothetical protein D3C77_716980 [compost metagenome]
MMYAVPFSFLNITPEPSGSPSSVPLPIDVPLLRILTTEGATFAAARLIRSKGSPLGVAAGDSAILRLEKDCPVMKLNSNTATTALSAEENSEI